MFFRNSLISDLLFICCLFFHEPLAEARRARAPHSAHGLTAMQPLSQRDEVEMLSLMLLIRRFENAPVRQYQAQKIGGFFTFTSGRKRS